MVFRFFRQNKQAAKWFYGIVTVFTMFTFSVTGAIYAFFREKEPGAEVAGSFVTPSGRKITVTQEDLRIESMKLARIAREEYKDDDAQWTFLMLDALANEMGIQVSDQMLTESLTAMFDQYSIPADKRDEFYKSMLLQTGLSASEWESLQKRILRTKIYCNLYFDGPRVRSEDVFKRFQDDNAMYTVEYASFRDADFAAKIDRSQIKDEDLQKYFDTEFDSIRKQREFSSPPEFAVDAAWLDVAKADVEKMRAALNEQERVVDADEIESLYNARKETKYKLPAAPADPAKKDDGTKADPSKPDDKKADEKAGDKADEKKPEEKEAPKYRPLEEVKAELEKEILVERVVQRVLAESNRRIAEAAKKKADAGKPGVTPNTTTPVVEENVLKDVATQFGMEYIEASPVTKWDDLVKLPRIGSEALKHDLEFVAKDGVIPFTPDESKAYGYVAHVVEKVDPKPFPLAQVKDKILDPYVEATAAKQADAAAKAFCDALREAVRPKQQAEIDKIQNEAKASAEKKIAEQKVTDDAAKKKIVDDELKSVEWRITGVLNEHKQEAFDDVVKAQAVKLDLLGPYRKSYSRSPAYAFEPAGTAKFLMGQFQITFLDVGKVSEPLRDRDGKATYVARVKEKTLPTFADMTPEDEQAARQASANGRDPQSAQTMMGYRYYVMSSQYYQFIFPTLSLQLSLQRAEKPDAKKKVGTP